MRTETYDVTANTTETRDGARAIIGRQAVFTTYEGERMVGTIEPHPMGQWLPVIRFADGRWGRVDNRVEIVLTEA
jgi:hypothetical protein